MKRQYLEDFSEFVPGSSVLQQFKYVYMLLLLGVPAWRVPEIVQDAAGNTTEPHRAM